MFFAGLQRVVREISTRVFSIISARVFSRVSSKTLLGYLFQNSSRDSNLSKKFPEFYGVLRAIEGFRDDFFQRRFTEIQEDFKEVMEGFRDFRCFQEIIRILLPNFRTSYQASLESSVLIFCIFQFCSIMLTLRQIRVLRLPLASFLSVGN